MEQVGGLIRGLLFGQVLLGITAIIMVFWQPRLSALVIAGLALVMIAATNMVFHQIEYHVNQTLEAVDDTIAQLLSGQQVKHFSPNDDTLLGKFQTQIAVLYTRLDSECLRQEAFRSQMEQSVSNLVHQLNTPITNIKLYSDFLKDASLSESKRQQFIDNICSQADKLAFLGEGFAKVSCLEAGMITLKPLEQPILPVILAAIDEIAAKADAHGNHVQLKGAQNLTARLDRKWTGEALLNVLDNAVKYSDRATAIVVEMLSYELFVRINIVNRGLPIAREEYNNIFQRFYRAEIVKDLEGVGLGLYLVREILKGQGGYIKVSRTNDGRTMFSLYLLK